MSDDEVAVILTKDVGGTRLDTEYLLVIDAEDGPGGLEASVAAGVSAFTNPGVEEAFERAEESRPMHQVIHALVDAQTREDALGVARGSVFDRLVGATRNGRREFDYYVTFDQEDTTVAGKARWGDLPIAARFNSEKGQELLARGWNATQAEFERNLQHVRAGFADLSDEQIRVDTNFVRHHCANLGAYAGPPIHLYDEFGNGIRTPEDFIWACDDLDEPWIVPADVHF